MHNLVLVTSVINTPNTPLSYCDNRSVYTREERFKQTQHTLNTIRKSIPNCIIFLVECTDFTLEENDYLQSNCDYILNLWDQKHLHPNIFGLSKALGEGTMTIHAIEYIKHNNIQFNNLFKISGRYYLDQNFEYSKYDNDKIVVRQHDPSNVITCLYKLPFQYVEYFSKFMLSKKEGMEQCLAYETLFDSFIKSIPSNDVIFNDVMGVQGLCAVTRMQLFQF